MGLDSKSTPAARDYEDEVLTSLKRIIRAVDLYSRHLLSRHGLSSPQLMCLRQLAREGPMLSGHLAAEVNMSPATLSGILDRLEARGLIRRVRQQDDKRRVSVELSTEGRRLLSRAPSPLQDGFLHEFRSLSRAQQAEIARVLNKLVRMMAVEGIDAATLMTPEAQRASVRERTSRKA